jgi:hypothetical protein
MASRRAIVAGPVSYLEIGAGAGGGSDYLVVGPNGIVGASGTLNMLADDTGSGSDKTIVIGEQGAAAATNVLHIFGTTTGGGNDKGTVKIHGNLEVEGTEDVLGNATFAADALFRGNTTFGDATSDTVSFVAGIASNLQFDASAGSTRTIDIEDTASGAGTSLVIEAGAAGGAGNDNGGNVTVVPSAPTGTGAWGAVKIGSPIEVDPDGKTGPRMLLNTGSAGEAGFRWNTTDSKLQYRVQSGAWTDLVGGGGVLPPSTDEFQILQANAGGGWNIANFLTLPSTLTGVGRLITVQTQDQVNVIGDILTVEAATGNGTGGGGELRLYGGDSPGTGATGGVVLASQVAPSTGNTGSVSISTGNVTSAVAGNISMTAGTASLSGTGGDVSIAAGGAQTGGSPGDVTITAGGATGANGGTNGGFVTVTGGSTDDGTGGSVTIAGGAATFGTTGGSTYVRGGASGSGTAGLVWIGDSNTSQIVFGDGGALTNALYANSDTPADRAGIRYNDTLNQWEYHEDGGGVTWTPFGSGSVPDGTVNYHHLRWDSTLGTPAWVVELDMTLPSTGDRTITIESGTGARVLTIQGQIASAAGNNGGDLVVRAGAGGSATDTDGTLKLYGGAVAGAQNPGDAWLNSGEGDAPYYGDIYIGSEGGAASGTGGTIHVGQGVVWGEVGSAANGIEIYSQAATNNDGGYIDIQGGSTAAAGQTGGAVGLQGGAASNATGIGGNAAIQGGTGALNQGGDALVVGGTGNTAAGHAYVRGGSGGLSGTAGNAYIRGGSAVGGNGLVWIGDATTSQIVFGDGGALTNAIYANSDTPADRAGIRYNDTTDKWQVHYDSGGVNWYDIITSNDNVLPTGAATGEILEWDQTGTQWVVAQDLALPDGAARTIGMKPHTTADAAYALTVSGQNNTSVGPGTTTGGQLTVKGGDSTAENAGDLILTGGVGSASNGDVLFGDGTNPTNIDFENTSGNRVISDITFLNTGTGSSYTIKPDTAISTNANGLLLGGAQGGTAATGGNGGGTSVLGGIGGPNNAGGTSGNGGTANLLAGTGGAGLTGTAGNGGNVTVYAGDAGAVGTVAGGSGGNLLMKAGAGTGNINGGAASLTGGAAVGTGGAGGVTITGGANSSTGNGGLVTITGGASTGGTAGGLILDAGAGTTNGSIAIGPSNATTIQFGQGANTFDMSVGDAIPILGANGTATIDLPGTAAATNNFRIQGTAVADTVTAPNLDTLTAGPTSDASALHTHDGIGIVTATAGENITNTALISMAPDGSNLPRAYMCDITTAPGTTSDGPLPVGFATVGATSGNPETIKQSGEITLAAARWALAVNPLVTDVGKPVYAYGTAGQVSLTPPASGSGDYRTKVGIVKSVVALTSATIIIQIGDSVLMA